jgi:hypothetical protein
MQWNHLLTPCHSFHEPIEVPFVRDKLEEYNDGLVDMYLVRKGWTDLTDQAPHLQNITQTRLFFGFLATFLAKGLR